MRGGTKVADCFLYVKGVKRRLSPILLGICTDVLLVRLCRAGAVCYIGKTLFAALCYANDITLVAPSRRSMSVLQ
jgi:hypothetical protein